MHLPGLIKWRLVLRHALPLALAMLLGTVSAYLLKQNYNWDLLNYHYYNAFAFVHHRLDLDIWPANLQSYNNPLLDLPFYFPLRHWKPINTNLVIGAAQGINAWIVYELALLYTRRVELMPWASYAASGLTAIASFLGAANLSEVGGSMGDNFISLFVLGAVYCLLRALMIAERKPELSTLRLRLISFTIMGFAVGLKLTAAIFAIALLAAGLLYGRSWRERISASIWHTVALGAGTLITGGYWYIKLTLKFGSPIFPFYNALFRSPYYPLNSFADTRFVPKGLSEFLSYPFMFATKQTLVSETAFRDARFAVMFVLLAAVIIVAGWRWHRHLARHFTNNPVAAFWIFMVLGFAIWEKVFSIYRYLIPAELLVPLGIFLAWSVLIRLVWLRLTLIVITFATLSIYTIPINWGRSNWTSSYFGVQFPAGYDLSNSLVLAAGSEPSAFIATTLQPTAAFVRIDPPGNTKMSSTVKKAIRDARADNKPIYMIQSRQSAGRENTAALKLGVKTSDCNAIFSYATGVVLLNTDAFIICHAS